MTKSSASMCAAYASSSALGPTCAAGKNHERSKPQCGRKRRCSTAGLAATALGPLRGQPDLSAICRCAHWLLGVPCPLFRGRSIAVAATEPDRNFVLEGNDEWPLPQSLRDHDIQGPHWFCRCNGLWHRAGRADLAIPVRREDDLSLGR